MKRVFFFFIGLVCALFVQAADTLKMKEMERIAVPLRMPSVKAGDTHISFPAVPSGYRLILRGTDRSPVVDTAGRIGMPLTEAEVQLYFQLQDKSTGMRQDIPNMSVTVKGTTTPVAGANRCPDVIPALREWVGAQGELTLPVKGNIRIDPAFEKELRDGAGIFASDLKEIAGMEYRVVTGKPQKGDIYLTLSTGDRQLDEEGYILTIGSDIQIEALTPRGAFWGTRTVLQMLDRQGRSLAKGTARDYPKYARRGFMLDVARKFFRLEFLQAYVKIMSYYKMNEFHVHLNDNGFIQYFDNDWDKTYAAFRLESETFPGLTAKDGYYTKAEFTALQRQGMMYGVNVFPEIDIPAHSLAFSRYKSSLGSKKYGMDHLDLFNPEIYDFCDALLKEYLEGPEPVFIGPDVHIGTDEYAKEAAEEFRRFTDHYLRYVQGFGKRARLWGALTHADGKTPVTSKGVIMNAWYNGYADPKVMIEQGYDLISIPDGLLYIVPAAGYYYDYLNLKHLYNNWEPVIVGKQHFPYGHPQILGGAFAVWNDHCGNGISEKDVHYRAFPAMQVLAEKMWYGNTTGADYSKFQRLMRQTREAPGINLMGKIASKGKRVLDYKPEDLNFEDLSGNGYDPVEIKNIKADAGNGLYFTGTSRVITPVTEIGYEYTVLFEICPAADEKQDAILFRSPNATVVLNEKESGKLAFMRDGYCYHFDYALPAGVWSKLAIQGDYRGTTLYVDGKFMERLVAKERIVKDKRGKESKMYIQRTLVFPLQQIGDLDRGFNGKIRRIEVYEGKVFDEGQVAGSKE